MTLSKIVISLIVCKVVLWETKYPARKRHVFHSDSHICFCVTLTYLPGGESMLIWFSEYILLSVLIELHNWTNVEAKEKSVLEPPWGSRLWRCAHSMCHSSFSPEWSRFQDSPSCLGHEPGKIMASHKGTTDLSYTLDMFLHFLHIEYFGTALGKV